jgi:hypothetical protein
MESSFFFEDTVYEYFSTVDECYCWTVCRDVTEAEYNIIQNNV